MEEALEYKIYKILKEDSLNPNSPKLKKNPVIDDEYWDSGILLVNDIENKTGEIWEIEKTYFPIKTDRECRVYIIKGKDKEQCIIERQRVKEHIYFYLYFYPVFYPLLPEALYPDLTNK